MASQSTAGSFLGSADDCAAADQIAGQGVFGFDTSGASTGFEGQNETLCYGFGTSAIQNDVWFEWTADEDGYALLDTCGSSFDTRLAVWPAGGCPIDGTSLACNDDACGLQSALSVEVQNGTTYLIQVGSFSAVDSGSGLLEIAVREYAYDTGASTTALGLLDGGGLGWLHCFDAIGGMDVVEEISTAYGSPLVLGLTPGRPVTLGIWDDPTNDCDPTDAVLLWSDDVTAGQEDTDQFNVYPVPQVPVMGSFFVGVITDNIVGEYPLPFDEDIPSDQSTWIVGNTTTAGGFAAFNPNDLAQNNVPPIAAEDLGIAGVENGVALLRAARAPVVGGKQYCFCATPKNGQNAAGNSEYKIRWHGTTRTFNPIAGETAKAFMTRVRDALAALYPQDDWGEVVVNPATARAVFCVRSLAPGSMRFGQMCDDANWKECTYRRVSRESNGFLNGVGGAFLAAAAPVGGQLQIDVIGNPGGQEQVVSVIVPTTPGQTQLNHAAVAALNAAGFDAQVTMYEVEEGQPQEAFILDPNVGPVGRISGIGIQTFDDGVKAIAVFGHEDGGGSITNYCVASPNSVSAQGASISVTGQIELGAENLVLASSPVPNQPGIFFFGPNQIAIPFGNGTLCVGGSLTRLPAVFAMGNNASYAIDFSSYGPALQALAANGPVNFQFWYRDPSMGGSGFNLSDGVEVAFLP